MLPTGSVRGLQHRIALLPDWSTAMLKLALIFLVVGLIAGALGFTGVAGAAVGIAKVIFFIGIALFLIFLVMMALGINALR
jgi:uncharacterized membrane protein YtjA (UPF0391 family)